MLSENISPNVASIKAHLHHITRRWGELDQPCLLELVFLTADDKARVTQTSHYDPTPDGIELAASDVVAFNKNKINAYATVNPVSATNRPPAHKRASAEHIVASFFQFADADDAQAAENIRNFVGPKPTFYVMTGTAPSQRPHVYWELEEPTQNLDAWSQTQAKIAATLKTDKVIDPPRIMRLGGTINWPKPMKVAKGYQVELTTLHIHDHDARPPVTSENMSRAFGTAAPSTGLEIDTGQHETMDLESVSIQAMSGQEWNNNVLRIVGRYVRKGLSDSEILTFCDKYTQPGYTVQDTRREVQDMIDRTRANPKFEGAGVESGVNFDHAPSGVGKPSELSSTPSWSLQSAADFTAGFVAPEYLIDGVMQRGRLYTLTAPTGSGKTAIMLYIAMQMAEGQPVCERETEQGDVIYMAGENPDDVRARVIMTMEAQGIDPEKSRLHFIPGTLSIRQDIQALKDAIAALPNCTMIVVDTLAAYFDGDDSNSNAQMLDFARVMRKLTEGKGKPAVVVPAHPVKNAAKNNLTPMGGSALLNEVDGNLCLWKREAAVEMHWQGKHRGAEFDPVMFELKGVQSEKVRDSKGRIMPSVMAVPLLEVRAMEIATTAHSIKEKLLLSIEGSDSLSITQRCVDVGLINAKGEAQKSTMSRRLIDLKEEGLTKSVLNNWYLTDKGEKAVEIILNGGTPVDLEAE